MSFHEAKQDIYKEKIKQKQYENALQYKIKRNKVGEIDKY